MSGNDLTGAGSDLGGFVPEYAKPKIQITGSELIKSAVCFLLVLCGVIDTERCEVVPFWRSVKEPVDSQNLGQGED